MILAKRRRSESFPRGLRGVAVLEPHEGGSMATVPRGLYGPKHDGILDPDRWTAEDRYVRTQDQLDDEDERDAAAQFSPGFVGALNAARRQAVGR
jgi:hypothetical protein